MPELDGDRFAKILALAGSDHDGEALAALRKARGMLQAAGMSFTDVAQRMASPNSAVDCSATFSGAEFDDLLRRWGTSARPKPKKPKGFTAPCGNLWASRAEYERFQASNEARFQADRRKHAAERAAIIERYGSVEAAAARDEREQRLHDVALPWLEGPNVAVDPGFEHQNGRWHDSMGPSVPMKVRHEAP